MTDQEKYQGWTHELWQCSRCEETAEWERASDDDDDPALATFETEGDTVTFYFRDKVRFHDEWMYQLRPLAPG